MADHIRAQVRAATVSALDAVGSLAGTVKPYRVWPIEPASLPLVAVHTPGDDVGIASPEVDLGDPETITRLVDLRVTAYRAAGEDVIDDALDEASKIIEATLGVRLPVAGVDLRLDYQGAALDWQGGDQPYGSVQMKWLVEAIQYADRPDELIA